jgi:hypothetical protein
LERLYNTSFQKQWERALAKLKYISSSDLEELDQQLRKLERYYDMSGMRKMSTALGTYPDDYAYKIKSLRSDLSESIARKFRNIASQVSDLVGEPEDMTDFDKERKRFDDALVQFRMLNAFFKRWKLHTPEYRYAGERFDFTYAMKELAHRLAKKRTVLMKEHTVRSKIGDYSQKTRVLEDISTEVGKLFSWYKESYLNVDGKNPGWIGSDSLEDANDWMLVDFLDEDSGMAPLERFRRVPQKKELDDIQRLFDRFVEFYRQHELVDMNEIGTISDYAKFRDYAANFSLYSEDANERLKAGLMEQMLLLHKVLRDAKERIGLKHHTERLLESSFAMYFAPIDEMYKILQRGYISSDTSIHAAFSGNDHDSLMFHVDADIKDGDIGFIFPLSKLVSDKLFCQLADNPSAERGLSESNTRLLVFSKSHDVPLKVDIRQGIFIAPRDKLVRYRVEGKPVRESCEDYFRRFFTVLANRNNEWFDGTKLNNWLSRHCIFYDDQSRQELLNMLRNKSFVSVINKFTNKRYDNLALSQVPGTLKPSGHYMTQRLELTQDQKELLKSDTFNLTLFEWEPKV